MIKAALFDLDGVVLDTESQYTQFWGQQARRYHPEIPGLENQIKGQTLVQIFEKYFKGQEAEQQTITAALNAFEGHMHYDYIPGFPTFVKNLRRHGVKTAVVTSSNREKMQSVYARRREFPAFFDRILTSEDFSKSKPDPDCYLKAAQAFGIKLFECVGFEDSFNGLKALRAAGASVVGLATTNPQEEILPYADWVIPDFIGLDYVKLCDFFHAFQE